MFSLELMMGLDTVLAHTEYDDVFFLIVFGHVPELDGLTGASWSSVFRVEIQH